MNLSVLQEPKKWSSCFVEHKNYKVHIAINNLHNYNNSSQKNITLNPALA